MGKRNSCLKQKCFFFFNFLWSLFQKKKKEKRKSMGKFCVVFLWLLDLKEHVVLLRRSFENFLTPIFPCSFTHRFQGGAICFFNHAFLFLNHLILVLFSWSTSHLFVYLFIPFWVLTDLLEFYFPHLSFEIRRNKFL